MDAVDSEGVEQAVEVINEALSDPTELDRGMDELLLRRYREELDETRREMDEAYRTVVAQLTSVMDILQTVTLEPPNGIAASSQMRPAEQDGREWRMGEAGPLSLSSSFSQAGSSESSFGALPSSDGDEEEAAAAEAGSSGNEAGQGEESAWERGARRQGRLLRLAGPPGTAGEALGALGMIQELCESTSRSLEGAELLGNLLWAAANTSTVLNDVGSLLEVGERVRRLMGMLELDEHDGEPDLVGVLHGVLWLGRYWKAGKALQERQAEQREPEQRSTLPRSSRWGKVQSRLLGRQGMIGRQAQDILEKFLLDVELLVQRFYAVLQDGCSRFVQHAVSQPLLLAQCLQCVAVLDQVVSFYCTGAELPPAHLSAGVQLRLEGLHDDVEPERTAPPRAGATTDLLEPGAKRLLDTLPSTQDSTSGRMADVVLQAAASRGMSLEQAASRKLSQDRAAPPAMPQPPEENGAADADEGGKLPMSSPGRAVLGDSAHDVGEGAGFQQGKPLVRRKGRSLRGALKKLGKVAGLGMYSSSGGGGGGGSGGGGAKARGAAASTPKAGESEQHPLPRSSSTPEPPMPLPVPPLGPAPVEEEEEQQPQQGGGVAAAGAAAAEADDSARPGVSWRDKPELLGFSHVINNPLHEPTRSFDLAADTEAQPPPLPRQPGAARPPPERPPPQPAAEAAAARKSGGQGPSEVFVVPKRETAENVLSVMLEELQQRHTGSQTPSRCLQLLAQRSDGAAEKVEAPSPPAEEQEQQEPNGDAGAAPKATAEAGERLSPHMEFLRACLERGSQRQAVRALPRLQNCEDTKAAVEALAAMRLHLQQCHDSVVPYMPPDLAIMDLVCATLVQPIIDLANGLAEHQRNFSTGDLFTFLEEALALIEAMPRMDVSEAVHGQLQGVLEVLETVVCNRGRDMLSTCTTNLLSPQVREVTVKAHTDGWLFLAEAVEILRLVNEQLTVLMALNHPSLSRRGALVCQHALSVLADKLANLMTSAWALPSAARSNSMPKQGLPRAGSLASSDSSTPDRRGSAGDVSGSILQEQMLSIEGLSAVANSCFLGMEEGEKVQRRAEAAAAAGSRAVPGWEALQQQLRTTADAALWHITDRVAADLDSVLESWGSAQWLEDAGAASACTVVATCADYIADLDELLSPQLASRVRSMLLVRAAAEIASQVLMAGISVADGGLVPAAVARDCKVFLRGCEEVSSPWAEQELAEVADMLQLLSCLLTADSSYQIVKMYKTLVQRFQPPLPLARLQSFYEGGSRPDLNSATIAAGIQGCRVHELVQDEEEHVRTAVLNKGALMEAVESACVRREQRQAAAGHRRMSSWMALGSGRPRGS